MSAFEFVFSLFGLLLGLSLVEVLSGMVRTVKSRKVVRIGWLTPLLGIFLMLHLTSFWTDAWDLRERIPATNLSLFVGLLVTSIYYFAASLVFPERPEDHPDLDAHFLENKRAVLGCVLASDIINSALTQSLLGRWTAGAWVSVPITLLLFGWIVMAKGKRTNLIILSIMIFFMVLGAVLGT